jgi:sugar lactone lactonase YvrE
MRRSTLLAVAIGAALVAAIPLSAASPFPDRIQLPNGFAPEGIAVAHDGTFYVGSIPTGAIYRGSVKTGEGAVLVPGVHGRQAIGVDVDKLGRVFVAGGPTGKAFVYDGKSGALIAEYELTRAETFVNDVVVTRGGAYFTDSFQQQLYRIPIGPDGSLGASSQTIPLSGDIVFVEGFNANGIEATPDGRTLVIVQSNTGKLFTVDAGTGVASLIDLGGETMTAGDGLLLDGRTLYVVRNVQNRVAVIALAPHFTSGRVVTYLTAASLDVPTTIDDFGRRLYAVNARFGTPVTSHTEYWITQLLKPEGA